MKKIFFSVLLVAIFSASEAQTFTATQTGNWSNPAIWQGGMVPGATISAGQVVIIDSNVTYNLGNDLTIHGRLVIGRRDTLKFPNNAGKNIKVQSGGSISIGFGALILPIRPSGNGNLEMSPNSY